MFRTRPCLHSPLFKSASAIRVQPARPRSGELGGAPAQGARLLSRFPLGALLAALLSSPNLAAQAEAEKPPPNVLLLVDTSGSMEFKTDGSFPNCVPGDPSSEKSRWIDLVEVMTGTFDNYSCWAQDRNSTDFRNEFMLGTVVPYDFGYINPFHRPLSGNCLYGPGVLPSASSPYEWPDRAVNTFELSGGTVLRPTGAALATHPGCAGFSQAGDGLLDIYKDQVRFGLMTFDARTSDGTGVDSGAANYTSGVDGNWSYYLGQPATGHPVNCAFDMVQEVGARNAAAPPWEGRLVGFGPPALADHTERNTWIQEVLLTTRPYGATPLAGQLDDARQFLWNDTSLDPLDPSATTEFGPSNDPNWRAANCRKTILIVLSDGEPNLDLRPYCEQAPLPTETAGRCPYDKPEDIVSALRLSPPHPSLSVETYVIGFALGNVTPAGGGGPISCGELTDAQCADPQNNIEGDEESRRIQACCTLNAIAGAGGLDETNTPRRAYFAENRDELRTIFADILDDVVQVATRTMPVFSSAGGDSQSRGFKFFSAFDPQPDPSAPQLWQGILERRRFVCSTDLEPEEQYDPQRGDDFAANVNSNPTSRRFYTVIADDGGDNRNSIRTGTFNDGIGDGTGTQVFADSPSALPPLVPPSAMQVTAASCQGATTDDECRDLILQHAVGITNAAGLTRCPGGNCAVFGGIFHSTPTVVPGRPSELLRDESYGNFVQAMAGDARPTALYTSTVDGFLHAFNLAPFPGSVGAADRVIDSPENNEIWSFIPPAVLPVMQTQYPSTPAILLDGLPIIKEVVASAASGPPVFERLQSEARAGEGQWHTVLVQGFGASQVSGGYFAIDITKPDLPTTADGDAGGPTFLWQLTRSASGVELFGSNGTPLITTVFVNAASGGPREVAVAVLPGGDAAPDSGTAASIGPIMETEPAEYQTVRPIRNYASSPAARSLTIVRLDTGEVIRTFRPEAGPFDSSVVTLTDIPAPLTGQPKAFPETTGSVADRIFIGDREGRIWRVDVSSQNPANWSMEVFYDAFAGGAQADSQPVVLPPVLSVNDEGNVTVAFATGDQQATSAPSTMVNRIISLTEKVDSGEFIAHVNWIQSLTAGDRVTGPMVLFNRGLYYSASRPPDTSGAACDVGQSKVFGTHFEDSVAAVADPSDTSPDPESGPAPAPGLTDELITSRSDGLIFGVSLEAEPTCASTEEVIDGNDSFGYGQVSMSRTVRPGRFFLTFEVSGSSADPRGVLEVRQELASPRLPVTFESFALIYE